ncbi:MAG: MBL fold metallo-hydrolase [Spirochaetales bacterium]|nr:MBL fold metallo-hydrolase [Spirochaetales bacterium]
MTRLHRKIENALDYKNWNNTGVALWWLGQAGFLIKHNGITILVDPYLSDALAAKYKGKKYPHTRMMDPPIAPEELTKIDYYLSSHAHSDHMDPGLIPLVAKNNPDCTFIIPAATLETGLTRGIPADKMILMDDGEKYRAGGSITIHALSSAHEKLSKNNDDKNLFLGYVIDLHGLTIYHSGDCIPYPGLKQKLASASIDLALLPVNGRSDILRTDGIAGNFTLDEALDLMNENISFMIPHHYGMFDFNTVSPDWIKQTIMERGMESRVFPAATGLYFQLDGSDE